MTDCLSEPLSEPANASHSSAASSALLGRRRSPVVVHCAFLLPLPTCQRLKNCYISELHQELLVEHLSDNLYS